MPAVVGVPESWGNFTLTVPGVVRPEKVSPGGNDEPGAMPRVHLAVGSAALSEPGSENDTDMAVPAATVMPVEVPVETLRALAPTRVFTAPSAPTVAGA